MKTHRVAGGAGVELNVVEAGNPAGQPIVFLHGLSQCSLAWAGQLASGLAVDFRLVAPDLRGHGSSGKPAAGYDDSRLWADDLHAVLTALRLERPVICSWSYAFPVLDYIRHYGEDAIGGLHLVGAITKLGTDDAFSAIAPETLAIAPGLFSSDVAQCVPALETFLRSLFLRQPPDDEFYTMLGYNVRVPPHVRQAMFSRRVDNDDLLATLRKPVLITHGTRDAVVALDVVARHRALVPHAQVDLMADAGHAPFRDDVGAFNSRLRAFTESLTTAGSASARASLAAAEPAGTE
jgi:pimeloyl-ACP methyl ester carboxylesterase